MLRTRAAAVSAATAAIALSWAAPANSVVTPATESHPKQPATASPEVVATGQSECDKPTQVRAGAWACHSQPTTSVAAAAGTSGHGFCTYQGCWSVIDSVRTTHKSTITYGYGKTKLGTGTFYFKTTASGGRNVSDWFYFTSTRGTRSTKLEAERLYLSSAYPGGNRISPRKYVNATCGPRGAHKQCRFPSGRAVTNDDRVARYTIKHTATWSDASSAYPGRWFIMAKSVKYRRSSTGLSYIADSQARRPSSPAGSGYYP